MKRLFIPALGGGGTVRKKWLYAVAVACIIGIVLAALSTSQYLRIHKEGLEEKSFCSLSEVIDCDIASASSYSTLAGVPAAWLGLITYLLIGGMAVFGAVLKREARATVTVAWFVSLAAFLYSLRMAYVLSVVLGVACIECIGMYIVNIFAVVGLWAALKIKIGGLGKFFVNYVRAVLKKPSGLGFAPKLIPHAVFIIIVFVLGFVIMRDAGGSRGDVSLKEKVDAHFMQSLYAIEADQSWPVWGNKDGPVTIVEFSDFECPFCRLAAFNIRPYLQEFKKKVRYYFVNYPLDQVCNPYLDHPMHRDACLAAAAVECALDRGDFWGFHDDIFRMSRNITRENLVGLAGKRNWDVKDFEACMDSDATKARILEEIETARKIHISGTPTLIVNGRRLKYWRDSGFLQDVVKEEIRRSKN